MSEYRNPYPTADVIIELAGERIVLIERGGEPFGLALPGGFVDEYESLEHAAMREAEEETGLKVKLREFLYCYSDPRRDPRHHTITAVFIGTAEAEPVAGDDARRAFGISVADLRKGEREFAFDHKYIVEDYIQFLDTGKRPTPERLLARYQAP